MKAPSEYTHEGEAHERGYRAGIENSPAEILVDTRFLEYQNWYNAGYDAGQARRRRIKARFGKGLA